MTALTLLTMTSFLVGLFTNNLMQRWWQIRSALNSVKSKSINLVNTFTASVAVNTLHCEPHIRAQCIKLTQTVKRYLQLAHALMYIRGSPTHEFQSEEIQKSLQERDLLTVFETSLLMPRLTTTFNHRLSSHVYAWVLLCLEKASAAGVLGPLPGGGGAQHIVTMFNELSLIQSASADVDMYVTTQLPYPFIQVTVLLVYMFLFQLLFVTTGMIGDGFLKQDPAIYITGYCTQVLLTFVMLGVLHLYQQLCNPIGPDGADLPFSTYMLEFEEQTDILVEALWSASCPPAIEDVTWKILSRSRKEQLLPLHMPDMKKGGEELRGRGVPILQDFDVEVSDLRAHSHRSV